MATLKDIAALQTQIDSAGFMGISKDDIVDILESMANVQIVMDISNGPKLIGDAGAINYVAPNAIYNTFNKWVRGKNTKGIAEQPVGLGPYDSCLLKAGAAGDWNFQGRLKGISSSAGTIEIRHAVLGTDGVTLTRPGYHDSMTVTAGQVFDLAYVGLIKGMVVGEKMMMEIKAPNGATITVHEASLWCKRG